MSGDAERRSGSPGARLPEVIRTRRDFLAAARAQKWVASGVILQGRDRSDGAAPRVGFTCSKKIGNAVTRNRAKRRLREAARLVLGPLAREGWDYVLIGRPGVTVSRPFDALTADLEAAMARIHRPRGERRREARR